MGWKLGREVSLNLDVYLRVGVGTVFIVMRLDDFTKGAECRWRSEEHVGLSSGRSPTVRGLRDTEAPTQERRRSNQ